MAAVGEEGNHDAPRNGHEDVVDVMVPVDDQASGDEARCKEGQHHGKPFPKARVVVRESLQLGVQIKRQKCAHEEGC